MKRVVRFAVALACALFLGPAAATAQDAPQPMEILQHALAAWNARATPAFITYDLNFRGTRKGGEFTRALRVDYDAGNRTYTERVVAASGAEPIGVHSERQRLFPDETFGLVPRVRSGAAEGASGQTIQTLAVARAVTRYPYDVELAGIETAGGRPSYHLHFVPRGDPDRYPVREAWIDVANYDVHRIVAREVERAGIISVPFSLTVDYAAAGPYWLVASGQAGATARIAFFSISAQGAATYANYQFPAGGGK